MFIWVDDPCRFPNLIFLITSKLQINLPRIASSAKENAIFLEGFIRVEECVPLKDLKWYRPLNQR
jgi:hypothetical protein